jgi:hypothetical protein
MRLTRSQICKALAEYYVRKFATETGEKPEDYAGKIWVSFDDSKRAYCIRGESILSHPDVWAMYPNGWSLLDYDKPAVARKLIAKIPSEKCDSNI